MQFKTTEQLQLALDFVESTGKNIFLTGKAGTGKTTFLQSLKKQSGKRLIVVAPTGVAAINAGGVTIHSFFQLSFGPLLPSDISPQQQLVNENASKSYRFNRDKINIIKSLDLLVIDEVSMVRADLLDGIDGVLRRFKNRYKPFGGVQLLMIGDLQQLAPIVKDDEWEILKPYYDTFFFFSSRSLKRTSFISIELNHIFRQSDSKFIDLLNKVRNNELNSESINTLNERYIPGFKPNDKDGYITLTTHNHQAQSINMAKLGALKTEASTFFATVQGDFPEYSYPTEYELVLKEGAQVMFIKNDPSPAKQFFNGKIGTLEHIDDGIIYVQCQGEPSPIEVSPLKWENTKYSINEETKEIEENNIGSFIQYPLKLAWAITIHKSQGLTFDRAIIDANSAFAHGQVYVALSRCRTLEGLVLSSKITTNAVITDKTVTHFNREVASNQPTPIQLEQAKLEYQRELALELFEMGQIQRIFDYTLRVISENASSFLPSLPQQLIDIYNAFKSKCFEVAAKFSTQIERIIQDDQAVEHSTSLQDRMVKAAAYFTPLLEEEILKNLSLCDCSSDNLDLETRAKEQVEKLSKALNEKVICLASCSNGFKAATYIQVRAKAAVDVTQKKRKSKERMDIPVPSEIKNPKLYNTLKSWRSAIASKRGISLNRIFPQSALYDIANKLPHSKAMLRSIKGFGKKKVEEYGDEIIAIVHSYRGEQGMQSTCNESTDNETISPKKKTFEITFDHYRQGQSIIEIAKERGVSEITISQHMAKCVEKGLIDISELLDSKKIVAITDYFLESKSKLLTPAKEALGDNYTYSEIRWVLSHLERNESLTT